MGRSLSLALRVLTKPETTGSFPSFQSSSLPRRKAQDRAGGVIQGLAWARPGPDPGQHNNNTAQQLHGSASAGRHDSESSPGRFFSLAWLTITLGPDNSFVRSCPGHGRMFSSNLKLTH
ncbi:hypothetical protein H1C71_035252 [Ictidomys tridecemlineatus]|nr:hypothetical protein H1C71_035252 [Ictidomys tridecemlineatus]